MTSTVPRVDPIVRKRTQDAMSALAFGAVGDGIANDSESIVEALGTGKLIFGSGTHHVSSESSEGAVLITDSGFRLADAKIVTDQVQKSAFRLISSTVRADLVDIIDCSFTTPVDGVGGGQGNNHHALKLSGVSRAHLQNLRVAGDLGISIHYGSLGLDERDSLDVHLFGATGTDLLGIGFELFGSQYGAFYGLSIHGDDGVGGRAVSHGVRWVAYPFAKNEFNVADVNVDRFQTGASWQQYCRLNHFRLNAHDCLQGVQLHGAGEAVPVENLSILNNIQANVKEAEYGIYDGSSHNTFVLNVTGCSLRGIEQSTNGGTAGLSRGSSYQGRILDTAGRLANLRGDRNSFDLQLFGRNTTDTTHGLLISGEYCQGRAIAFECNTGVLLTGDHNRVDAIVTDCNNAITVSGANNAVYGTTDGTITAPGEQNIFSGHARKATLLGSERNQVDLVLSLEAGDTGILLSGDAGDLCVGSQGRVVAKGGLVGINVQRYCFGHDMEIVAEGIGNAILVQGSLANIPLSELSVGNRFSIVARGCGYALRDAGSHNDFTVIADGCTTGGILQDGDGGTDGLSTGNNYRGVIRDSVGRLCELKGHRNQIDLQLFGANTTDTTFGLLIVGNYNGGKAVVRNCATGLRINGDNNRIDAVVTDCSGQITIEGDNNILTIQTDGNLVLTGANNVVRGKISGTVTDNGIGNLIAVNGNLATATTSLTTADGGAINSGDSATDGIIANMRTRIAELETALQTYGLLDS